MMCVSLSFKFLTADRDFMQGEHAVASMDGKVLYKGNVKSAPKNGFVAFGTDMFGHADFDNLAMSAS